MVVIPTLSTITSSPTLNGKDAAVPKDLFNVTVTSFVDSSYSTVDIPIEFEL